LGFNELFAEGQLRLADALDKRGVGSLPFVHDENAELTVRFSDLPRDFRQVVEIGSECSTVGGGDLFDRLIDVGDMGKRRVRIDAVADLGGERGKHGSRRGVMGHGVWDAVLGEAVVMVLEAMR
jgi:hypothetical protein